MHTASITLWHFEVASVSYYRKVWDPRCGDQKEPLLGTQCCICKLEGPRPWMSPARARRRSGTAPVKHGCALEEGKMLNCVGFSRQKQQTWLDWLTISLSWDTIRRKPVSVGRRGGSQVRGLLSRPSVSVGDVDAT